ncbi:MAG TPA: isoleucine--tRNA ligase, partial [Acidimicrobiaceae bacterium]|nr:isoleucine--tRNA ligase [Acidimicrobiaceae bacterium]
MSEAKDNTQFSFVEMEHSILEFWENENIFQKSLQQSKEFDPYVFYDGPPFATGLPHHGHLTASTIKDIIPRYWTMQGKHVSRRFGWDCHGVPIEWEIDKKLKMSAQEAVAKLGVKGYNDECRSIVQRYVAEWRSTITRLGRWVDFDDDYKTMDPWYMESVWWVFKQLWDKGLVYKGFKVMPISTALGTPLANFEVSQNYRDVQDPAVTVLFKIKDQERYLAAWTTTPWTLPSNLAVCVGDEIDYVLVRDESTAKNIYFAEELLTHYGDFEILERVKGSDLVGLQYEPLFDYFTDQQTEGGFVVVSDDYVTTDGGTGLVHQAPAFGEDDYRVLNENDIDAFVCPVGLDGRFDESVTDFSGMHVKEADKSIIEFLKQRGSLYRQEVIQHSYPFCPRSDTPLIYVAIPAWYVRTSSIVDKLVSANDQIHWVPEHIKEGRFGNWLKGEVDWGVSRNRVWGTPIPIWINDETGKAICIGSKEELKEYSGVEVSDFHREHVDPLTFDIEGEPGTYRRIEEVLDCWFESGSMPYAQLHYPFENHDVFKSGFPAEFIAEGLDQTRGWFYTLTVLAAAIFDKPAFNNVIVNGLVLAEDGKKMSKSLQNYTPPDNLMEQYGADALRLYLINSGLVKAEEQRFVDSGVHEMTRRALLPWFNAFSFLKTYAEIDEWSPKDGFSSGDNVLDQWMVSRLQTLKEGVSKEMSEYRLYNVVPKLFDFIEDLTNWYIRLNRSRFWGEGMDEDKVSAFNTLYSVLYELSKVMAPFAPFLSEHLYRELSAFSEDKADKESVHLCRFPEFDLDQKASGLEVAVDRMQQVVLLGRQKRESVKIGLRTPLSAITIIHRDESLLEDMKSLEGYVRDELNVREVRYSSDEGGYIDLAAKPNFSLLGKRLGKNMRDYQKKIGAMTFEEISSFQQSGEIRIEEEVFSLEEIEIFQKPKEGTATISNSFIAIELDCELTPELIRGGYAREVVNRIQRARKE